MKTINLNKTWDHVVAETHRCANRIQREALFGLQILLSQYELAKNESDRKLMNFYTELFEIYEKHNINGHIVWKK